MQGSLLLLYHAAGRGFEKCVRALLAVCASTTLPQVVENKVCIANLDAADAASQSMIELCLKPVQGAVYTPGQGSSVIV